ncbi:MAG TPA: prolipoprotein diacylglyceryl transferase [Steroidobacteraceae bacterium]|nr:prolipoprotein diacylglyceryl transferase [Steroidobacteraceae bacterium]
MIIYPHINPIAISIGPVFGVGPLRVHWYGIMYLIGFAAAWTLARYRARQPGSTWSVLDVDDVIFYIAVGVIVGGRVGWCVFYGHDVIAENWLNAFHIWDGGMSFHGGLTGVIIAGVLFARTRKKAIPDVFDFMAPLPGIGLFAGRIGNFINGELWGRPTDLPWGFGVPNGAGELVSRHPSQLYEATLEGIVLFLILWWYTSRPRPRLAPSGLFLLVYGCARFTVEWVRLPDANIGYLAGDWLTMGMLLTTPMIVIGAALLVFAYRRKVASGNSIGAEAGGAKSAGAGAARGNSAGRDAGAKV